MAEELEVSRGGNDPRATLKAQVEAQFGAALEQAATLELAEAPAGMGQWEVYAWGPWQDPGQMPGRIIQLGETAYIATAVWMDDVMCANIVGFEGKIELSYWTSNTQTMRPVPDMDHVCCIFPTPDGGCFYITVWEFVPTEAACVLETNICARICNCQNHAVPGYAAFVRHCWDFDPSNLWPAPPRPGWAFDRPIRYMVSDMRDCVCDPSNTCP